MRTAVTGATGQLGRIVVKGLKAKLTVADIVAVVRNSAKAKDLEVEAREADYNDAAALGRALSGVDTLLLISGSEVGQRTAQHRNIIEAATKNGVKWIVYTSLLHADSSVINLAAEHRVTEAALRASGIPFTLLRNGWYTENYAGSIPGALQGGAFIGAAGEGKISSAARADYAQAAIEVLTGEGHAGKTYELAGDEAWTLSDLAAEISRQTGRLIPYRNMSESEYANALKGFGLPATLAESIASWDTAAANGALYDDSRQLSRLIGRPTTPLAKVVASALEHR